jgi:RNA polymerase sigma-70 factor (ECF subfamily)
VRSHVGSPDEALDVTQASFVAAFAALNRYDATLPGLDVADRHQQMP